MQELLLCSNQCMELGEVKNSNYSSGLQAQRNVTRQYLKVSTG